MLCFDCQLYVFIVIRNNTFFISNYSGKRKCVKLNDNLYLFTESRKFISIARVTKRSEHINLIKWRSA